MGHLCPECGCGCHCHGDIDDLILGERYDCDHCCPGCANPHELCQCDDEPWMDYLDNESEPTDAE